MTKLYRLRWRHVKEKASKRIDHTTPVGCTIGLLVPTLGNRQGLLSTQRDTAALFASAFSAHHPSKEGVQVKRENPIMSACNLKEGPAIADAGTVR